MPQGDPFRRMRMCGAGVGLWPVENIEKAAQVRRDEEGRRWEAMTYIPKTDQTEWQQM